MVEEAATANSTSIEAAALAVSEAAAALTAYSETTEVATVVAALSGNGRGCRGSKRRNRENEKKKLAIRHWVVHVQGYKQCRQHKW